ncbi:MAG: OmpA family protein [Proteobacteria bacterium]|nr:OmpA family protein [Pseudomonadota bacterium]
MGKLPKPLLMAAGLTLAACSGFQLERAQGVTAQGSAFDTALYGGYIELSRAEFAEGDFADSDFFALRAIQSGTGGGVGPQEIGGRRLPENMIPEFASARRKLAAVLEDTASQKAPGAAARAQVMFDCWMQEQEENFQRDHIAACRSQFLTALEEAQNAVEPAAPPAVPIGRVESKSTPAPTPAPAVALRPAPVRVVILFDFDSAEVGSAAEASIRQIIAAVRGRKRARISLSGHTDRAGADAYNNRLAERRVEAVANALSKDGIADARVSLLYFGETRPAIQTEDGVREPRNRRVEVIVE